MDFFAAQDLARTRTRRLVVLFALAVLGIVVSTSALVFVALEYDRIFPDPAGYAPTVEAHAPWWATFIEHADIFAVIAAGTIGLVGLASLYKWAQVRAGGHVVAEMLGGVQISPNTTDLFEQRLVNVVEEMAIASGIPIPAVYLLPHEASINAFAAGLTTSDAVVAVTRGCLEKLSRDELQGVVAHEFGHVLNGDMRLNVQILALLHGILFIAIVGRVVMRMALHSGGSRRSSNKGGGAVVAFLAAGAAIAVIGYAGFFFGRMIQAAVSRQREYLADASAVQFTRNPLGIAGALKKIGGFHEGSTIEHPLATEVRHAFFAQGFRSRFSGMMATHPPLLERIRAIEPSFDGEYLAAPDRDAALSMVRAEERRHRAVAQAAGAQLAPARAAGSPTRAAAGPAADLGMRFSPAVALAGIGTLSESNVAHARALKEALPAPLVEAAHDPATAPALIYGLLLDRHDARIRDGQLALLAREADPGCVPALRGLLPELSGLATTLRLPLVQIALPSLKPLRGAALDRFLHVIHGLVHFDGHVDVFEVALQKVLVHHLRLAARPTGAKGKLRALPEVAREVNALLSTIAHLAGDEESTQRAFHAGVARLPTVGHLLKLAPEGGFDALDQALATLDQTSLGVRKQILDAAAHTVAGDGTITEDEVDLLRAIASVFDCPMPPLAVSG